MARYSKTRYNLYSPTADPDRRYHGPLRQVLFDELLQLEVEDKALRLAMESPADGSDSDAVRLGMLHIATLPALKEHRFFICNIQDVRLPKLKINEKEFQNASLSDPRSQEYIDMMYFGNMNIPIFMVDAFRRLIWAGIKDPDLIRLYLNLEPPNIHFQCIKFNPLIFQI